MVLYCFCPNIISQGWSWLENKITESNDNIAETIYIPFHNGHFYLFWPCAATCGKQFSEENSCNQISNWTTIIPESGEIILLEEINVDFEYLTLSMKSLIDRCDDRHFWVNRFSPACACPTLWHIFSWASVVVFLCFERRFKSLL
jgi:hypothetical protein